MLGAGGGGGTCGALTPEVCDGSGERCKFNWRTYIKRPPIAAIATTQIIRKRYLVISAFTEEVDQPVVSISITSSGTMANGE